MLLLVLLGAACLHYDYWDVQLEISLLHTNHYFGPQVEQQRFEGLKARPSPYL